MSRPVRFGAALALIVASLGPGLPDGAGQARAQEQQATAVKVDAVRREVLVQTLPVIGRFIAIQAGEVAARINGPVAEVMVEVGDRAAEGDVLVVISSESLEAMRALRAAVVDQQLSQIRVARAELKKAQLELQRLEKLRANGSAAFQKARFDEMSQEVDRNLGDLGVAQAELAQARANLRLAEIDLEYASVRAPYPGVVTLRHTMAGAYLSIGDPVVTLVNDLDLEIEADVPAISINGLAAGTRVAFELADGSSYHATVRAIVPEENPLTRTRPIRFSLPPAHREHVAANQSATIQLPIGGEREGDTVHKDAVTRRLDKYVVYMVEEGIAQLRTITIGDAVGNRLEVRTGLEPGDLVVVRGNERLRPGQAVHIEDEGE
jgi:RND family efflux transporter MFP subunit